MLILIHLRVNQNRLIWIGVEWPGPLYKIIYMDGTPCIKTIPEGFGLAKMYTSTRNPQHAYIPTIIIVSENY